MTFLHFNHSEIAASTTIQTTTISSNLSFIIQSTFSQNFSVFTLLFHSGTSKFTITTAQLPFYNCKLHFTTAEIVISCTLKYALPEAEMSNRLILFAYLYTAPIAVKTNQRRPPVR